MLHRRNKNLRIVEDPGDPTDKVIGDLMKELGTEDGTLDDLEADVRNNKAKIRRRMIFGTIAVVALAVLVFLIIYLQTYTNVRVSETYKVSGVSDNNYKEFQKGILKYGRDGIAYLNYKGEEQWNQPYQIKTPFAAVNGECAVVADKDGNDIVVFDTEGLKGEIHTTLPIEKISVSEQGIVSAILKSGTNPKVVCYDTAGNVLAELKSSFLGNGYPMDVALSDDGKVMQVVYMSVSEGKIISKVVYYNFDEAGEKESNHQVAAEEYEGSLAAEGFYMDGDTSAVVGDDFLTIFKGKDIPEKVADISLDKEIQSVFHNEKYIGMVLKNDGKNGYEIRMYNRSGKMVMSEDFNETYGNAKISGSQAILYDGKKCCIFMRNGIQRFEGETENGILEVIPILGVNKYIIIDANGMEHVRLVK